MKTKTTRILQSKSQKYYSALTQLPTQLQHSSQSILRKISQWWRGTKSRPVIKTLAFCSSLALTPSTQAAGAGNLQLELGATAALLDNELGYGGSVTFLGRISPETAFYVGLESGLSHWSSGQVQLGGSHAAELNVIPVLAVAQYEFEIDDSSVRPYLGIAPGVGFAIHGSVDPQGDQAALKARTDVYFELLFKPGVAFGSFFVEPKLGLIDGNFVFLPTVGLVLAI